MSFARPAYTESDGVSSLDDVPVEHRIAVIKGFLNILRLAYQHTDGDMELAAIIAAIRLGDLERRLLDVSAISAVTGVPRSTVQRKMRDPRMPEILQTLRQGRRVVATIPQVSRSWTLMGRNVMQTFMRVGRQLGLK